MDIKARGGGGAYDGGQHPILAGETIMRMFAAVLALAAAPAFASNSVIDAEAVTDGRTEYHSRCAVCHGTTGTGDGPFNMYLTVAPADLTSLSQRNGGTFPTERVYRVIDGRREVMAHGPREMPVWGREFNDRALEYYDKVLGAYRAEQHIHNRIMAIIRYLESIQVE